MGHVQVSGPAHVLAAGLGLLLLLLLLAIETEHLLLLLTLLLRPLSLSLSGLLVLLVGLEAVDRIQQVGQQLTLLRCQVSSLLKQSLVHRMAVLTEQLESLLLLPHLMTLLLMLMLIVVAPVAIRHTFCLLHRRLLPVQLPQLLGSARKLLVVLIGRCLSIDSAGR